MGLLRLLLSVAVFIAHAGPLFGVSLMVGSHAVQGFFVLSGFYMALVLNEKYASFFPFYKNRILRLYPAYLAMLAIAVVVGIAFHIGGSWRDLSPFTIFVTGFSQLTLIGLDILPFFGIREGALFFANDSHGVTPMLNYLVVGQAATLGIELWFYALAPFVARRKWYVVAGLMALSICLRIVGYHFGFTTYNWEFRYFPFEFALFGAGILSYKLYARIKQIAVPRALGWGALVGMIVATCLQTPWPLYCVLIAFATPFVFPLSKDWRWDRHLGDLSYTLYLTHVTLIDLLKNTLHAEVILLLSLILAEALIFYVERPMKRFKS